MANITLIPVEGYVNRSHVSTLTPFYPPNSIPMPWPLVILSILISLTICCLNCKSAFVSMKDTIPKASGRPRSAWSRMNVKYPPTNETELQNLHQPTSDDIPPPYDLDTAAPSYDPPDVVQDQNQDLDVRESRPAWEFSPLRKGIDIFTIIFSTYRAITAFILAILILFLPKIRITFSPPSVLLLALLASQIQLQNLALPSPFRFSLTFDVLLLTTTFLITSYSRISSSSSKYSYAELQTTGGNCPIYSSTCLSQPPHWSRIGCGNWTTLIDYTDTDSDAMQTSSFYSPYVTNGSINTDHNPLHVIEAVIIVFGTIWLFTAVYQIYSVGSIIRPMKLRKRDTKRGRCQGMLRGFVPLFGLVGAVGAALISIGGHLGQETRAHRGTYLDSFGPVVVVNTTMGAANAITYEGNTTSWSDCFVLDVPAGMRWKEWIDGNQDALWRVGGLV